MIPKTATLNLNQRQPHVVQPIGHGGLNANRVPSYKTSPTAMVNPLQRKPLPSR